MRICFPVIIVDVFVFVIVCVFQTNIEITKEEDFT